MGRHRAPKPRPVPSRAARAVLAAATAAGAVGVGGVAAGPALAAAPSSAAAAVSASADSAAGFRFVDITASDGVVLEANVIEPGGPGLHPAVVFVNSWGLNDLEYLAQATKLAQRGYTVLSYTTRGFWGSGGQIDTAGPKDIADVSTVIDWMLANTTADPGRIGIAGVSYGAGISLIAAAHDPRIKAVTAMSAWTDLVSSLYGNQTRHLQATGLLDVAAELTGHPSDELTQMIDDMYTDQNIDQVQAWAKVRSAGTYIDQLNANGTAVYIANAFGDSLFGPDQLVDFYDRLTVPDKRLDLAPGDHATVEGLGLAALPNAVWANVGDWLDEHVAGTKTGVRDGITLTPYGGSPEAYPTWQATATHTVGYDFGAGYRTTIASGRDTVADAGVPLITNGLAGLTGVPPTMWLPAVDRGAAAVWQSGWLSSTAHVRGIANLHIDLTPSASSGTAVAYLYDVDVFGTAKLMAHVPYTYLNAQPGQAMPVDFRFGAAAFDVPAGHRLAVVVDTKDPLYGDADVAGSTLTLGSTAADHAVLTVPER